MIETVRWIGPFCKYIIIRKWLNIDTVSANKSYAVDTVSANKSYAIDTHIIYNI